MNFLSGGKKYKKRHSKRRGNSVSKKYRRKTMRKSRKYKKCKQSGG